MFVGEDVERSSIALMIFTLEIAVVINIVLLVGDYRGYCFQLLFALFYVIGNNCRLLHPNYSNVSYCHPR